MRTAEVFDPINSMPAYLITFLRLLCETMVKVKEEHGVNEFYLSCMETGRTALLMVYGEEIANEVIDRLDEPDFLQAVSILREVHSR